MMMNEIESYIQRFPSEVQEILRKIRAIIKNCAPDAVESMSYALIGYKTKYTS